ncbi:hypothetical protein HNQ88_001881 [Aureibacter tunicatorum]|uniref:Uncharacterized protein n=1 Tax=Aureibacter tunicatorum TaxID=866807 RepID=A0AAE3XMX1_9BACT|nr:hypothetical protein [Aureibacter tunicatorum]BDD05229.1 hypothetical protein AUTU_27120 [Aureibacter tunicatorum]
MAMNLKQKFMYIFKFIFFISQRKTYGIALSISSAIY